MRRNPTGSYHSQPAAVTPAVEGLVAGVEHDIGRVFEVFVRHHSDWKSIRLDLFPPSPGFSVVSARASKCLKCLYGSLVFYIYTFFIVWSFVFFFKDSLTLL